MIAVVGRRKALLGVALVVLVWFVATNILGPRSQRFDIRFAETKGLYVGNPVTVLGVTVGKVIAIRPERDNVDVTVEVDQEQPVPADAKAVLTSPSLVPIRSVALAPVYRGGPRLADGSTIPLSRTAVPVEWDDVKTQLARLATALGPDGANAHGSLSRFLTASAANLEGQGGNLGHTISLLSEAMQTLAGSSGDLFASIRNLQVFTAALQASDSEVYVFNDQLATVTSFLSADRSDLARAIDGMGAALTKLRTFIATNRAGITSTIKGFGRAAALLARNRQALADLLQVAPTAVDNLFHIGDPNIPAPTGSIVANNLDSPAMFICSALYSLGGTPQSCVNALEPIARYLRLQDPPVGLSLTNSSGVLPGASSPPTTLRALLSGGGS